MKSVKADMAFISGDGNLGNLSRRFVYTLFVIEYVEGYGESKHLSTQGKKSGDSPGAASEQAAQSKGRQRCCWNRYWKVPTVRAGEQSRTSGAQAVNLSGGTSGAKSNGGPSTRG